MCTNTPTHSNKTSDNIHSIDNGSVPSNTDHLVHCQLSNRMVPIAVNISSGVNSSNLLDTQVALVNSSGPSPGSDETSNMQKDNMIDNEAEGVWSPDIENSFHEALAIYPPCGRRKIILSDEGKMYGRNELIARYIKLRTGKTRTRKQVSSHIQVLARRKSREMQSQFKDQATKDKMLQSMASMSSAQIVSAGSLPSLQNNRLEIWPGNVSGQTEADIKPFQQTNYMSLNSPQTAISFHSHGAMSSPLSTSITRPPITTSTAFVSPNTSVNSLLVPQQWPNSRQIASRKLRLNNFSAFREATSNENDNFTKHLFVNIEQPTAPYADQPLEKIRIHDIFDKFPDSTDGLSDLLKKGPSDAFYVVKFWADLNFDGENDPNAVYAVTSEYESNENMTVSCSTKVCSFGKQVVEKIEVEYGRFEKDRYLYRFSRSQMCDYMINFIIRLKLLPERHMMNSVLENFTIQQLVTNRDTNETLLCLAYIFEVSTSEHGAQHQMYQLVSE